MIQRAKRGSGEQQQIQPRQTDDKSDLLELDVVWIKWGDVEGGEKKKMDDASAN
jgi:hypothetical protein